MDKMTKKLKNHNDVLEALAAAIDIPEYLDELARNRFRSLGDWLDREQSSIKQYDPSISPQGSFLIGTVIRPISDKDHYDVDLVCTLDARKHTFTMRELKEVVGKEIKAYAKANKMQNEPQDARRCWTLDYADSARFHMDILPSLPDSERYKLLLENRGYRELAGNAEVSSLAIAITDNTLPQYEDQTDDWPVSNPKGYALWFASRQKDVLTAKKRILLEQSAIYASVDDVPDYKVKTPLQQSVQLLKRHRDTMFDGDEDRPISIIISTLAAHTYTGEQTLEEALRTILRGMRGHIREKDGIVWIANPVNPDENFADKWPGNPRKQELFFHWLDQAQRDFGQYMANPYGKLPERLQERMSERTMGEVLSMIALAAPAIVASSSAGEIEAAHVVKQGTPTKPWAE